MYLSESRWRQLGRRNKIDVMFYSALPVMFPPCLKYSDALNKVREQNNIPVFFKHQLKSINKDNMTAKFLNKDTEEEEVEVPYDFLHIVPPQTAPKFIAESPLAAKHGFVEANRETMQHPRYPNVFTCGDVAGVPSSKTAASTFSQVPVLVHNLNKLYEGKELEAKYNGYGSCPLFTGDNKLMLAEFKYDGESCETFYSGQDKPSRLFYHMKKLAFPNVYFNLVPKGQWYGNKTIFKPRFF